ncbi:uncharacterized [Tachysurus ichikawai]
MSGHQPMSSPLRQEKKASISAQALQCKTIVASQHTQRQDNHLCQEVYVTAIVVYHMPVLGASLGWQPLVYHFLHSARQLRHSFRQHIPS